MDKMKMHSPDLSQQNVEKLKELFPSCVTESKDENGKLISSIDFDLLKQELSDDVVASSQERYRIDWPGKREAILIANTPIANTLRPARGESVDFDNTKNLFIEGDNLAALKLLQETYLNKVKMIYIDPPYNTGKDFIFKDDYTEDLATYLERSNQVDDNGNRLKPNNETNGRFHSNWLSMMYPRLKLARNLLRDDGIIFISIDDNEQANLKQICDEVFGAKNKLLPFIWSLPRGINAGYISKAHEYVLVYAKNKANLKLFKKSASTYSIERCNKKIDRRHPASEITFPSGIRYEGKNQILTGVIGDSEKIEIIGEMIFNEGQLANEVKLKAGWTMKNKILDWLSGKEVFDNKNQLIEEFFFRKNGKLYSKKITNNDSPKSLLADVPDNQDAKSEIELLFSNPDVFSYPKPSKLIQKFVNFILEEDDIVMDFFAGSATTAQAIFQNNIECNKNNKFILIQLPEQLNVEDKEQLIAYNFCIQNNLIPNIAELSKERIRRAGKKIKEENPNSNLDIGFRVLKVGTSNMKDVYYLPDEVEQADLLTKVNNIKPDRTTEDLLFQVLLDWGVDLTLPIEKREISGKTVYFVDENALVACFDEGIDETFINDVAEVKPLRVVFRDSGFASDAVKINVTQIFKLISPDTDIRTI
ncbi:site-specific DNA-methyltransferase [Bartonella apis]|uniref:site-specific DNA-methyltransferase n=1 Tax=Bartonella apis TaxID=1686310 RepID=UPI0039974271